MNHATLVVIVLFIVGVLLFAVISNTNMIYSQQVATNTAQVPPPSSSSVHRLHAVKITSPTRGQQIPSGNNNLTISGTSIANATSHCQISVLVNDVWHINQQHIPVLVEQAITHNGTLYLILSILRSNQDQLIK
jgi:hypothetical protein